jgi:hypothetical protein
LCSTLTATTTRTARPPWLRCCLLQVLKNLKASVDARVSVLHSATILANALVHAGG